MNALRIQSLYEQNQTFRIQVAQISELDDNDASIVLDV